MTFNTSEYSEKIFEAFAATSDSRYIFICNMWTDISRWSRNAVEYFNLPGEYMEGVLHIWENLIHPEDRKAYREDIEEVFAGKKRNHDIEYRVKNKYGDYVVVNCSAVVIDDEEGRPAFFAGTITNHGIIDNVDSLTNLYNYYEFMKRLREWKKNEIPGSLLLIGFNHFSEINDIHGFLAGNEIMKQFAVKLREVVSDKGLVFHVDGTKFAILSSSLKLPEMEEIYKIIQGIARNEMHLDENHVTIDLGGGIVVVEDFKVKEEEIHSAARYALEKSKKNKHGELVIVYNDGTDYDKSVVELLSELRNCILNDCEGFYMCYQPVVDCRNGKMTGLEALLRWHKEPFGEVSPGIFIPLLEKDPIFFELGNWILSQTMKDGKEFLADHPEITINVNISYTQLERSEFRSRIVSLLTNADFPPEHLCLELTERCSFLDMDFLCNEIEFLKSYGIKIALDDFGTGFASLNLLRVLKVDCIKIDREFIKNIMDNETDQIIVRAVTQCAYDLSVPVCVEGIEDDELREYMLNYKVNTYQGYLFSKPVEKEMFKLLDCY